MSKPHISVYTIEMKEYPEEIQKQTGVNYWEISGPGVCKLTTKDRDHAYTLLSYMNQAYSQGMIFTQEQMRNALGIGYDPYNNREFRRRGLVA